MTKPVYRKRVPTSPTPVRVTLRPGSSLQQHVKDGLGAVIKPHLIYFDESIRRTFADSLNIDNALKEGREQEHRWDYLVGHGPSNKVIAVEPHSAENSEITTLINKRSAARRQLLNHICKEQKVAKWIWVASGKVHLTPLEKATFILALTNPLIFARLEKA